MWDREHITQCREVEVVQVKKKGIVPNCHSPNAVSHTRTWRASTCRGDHRECYSEVGGWVEGGNIFICEENQQQCSKHCKNADLKKSLIIANIQITRVTELWLWAACQESITSFEKNSMQIKSEVCGSGYTIQGSTIWMTQWPRASACVSTDLHLQVKFTSFDALQM